MKKVFFVILVCLSMLNNHVAVSSGKNMSSEEKREHVVRRIIDKKEKEYKDSLDKDSLKKMKSQADISLIGLHAVLGVTAVNCSIAACNQNYSNSYASNLVTGLGVVCAMVFAKQYKSELRKLEIQENSLEVQQRNIEECRQILMNYSSKPQKS